MRNSKPPQKGDYTSHQSGWQVTRGSANQQTGLSAGPTCVCTYALAFVCPASESPRGRSLTAFVLDTTAALGRRWSDGCEQ